MLPEDRIREVEAANKAASERFNPMRIPRSLEEALGNRTVLVTGGTGSIGSEIVNQVLQYKPRVVRVLSRNEYNQYAMRRELGDRGDLRYLIGDVRDRDRLMRACEGVDVVFHASALKHVAICEYNPFEAVKTNVLGTQNLVEAALNYNMELLVGISTDKAVSPTNTMGATKLLAERMILSASQYKGDRRTRFGVIRFGNVLASRGSAIPMFIEQIRRGGPVTITHPQMRRFFMSIPQAVELALAPLDGAGPAALERVPDRRDGAGDGLEVGAFVDAHRHRTYRWISRGRRPRCPPRPPPPCRRRRPGRRRGCRPG